jgi:hypothetical protein
MRARLTELFHLYRIAWLTGALRVNEVEIELVFVLDFADFANIDCGHFYE